MGGKSLIYGVGVNDADYVTKPCVNGKQVACKYYITWKNMLTRCYSKEYHQRYPTYIGCTVNPDWHYFSNFKSWMEQQDWEGKQLDKDILIPNNKVYTVDTCLFVTNQVNRFFANIYSNQGEWPVGVCWHKRDKKYIVQIGKYCKLNYIGLYTCPQEASKAYYAARQEYLKELIDIETCPRVKSALEQYIGVDI